MFITYAFGFLAKPIKEKKAKK